MRSKPTTTGDCSEGTFPESTNDGLQERHLLPSVISHRSKCTDPVYFKFPSALNDLDKLAERSVLKGGQVAESLKLNISLQSLPSEYEDAASVLSRMERKTFIWSEARRTIGSYTSGNRSQKYPGRMKRTP